MAAFMNFHVAEVLCILFSILLLFTIGMKRDVFSTKTSYHWVQDPNKMVSDNEYMFTTFEETGSRHIGADNQYVQESFGQVPEDKTWGRRGNDLKHIPHKTKGKGKEKSCTAMRLEAMLRHGARQPGYKDIRKMTELHQKLKITVTSKDYPFLETWENHFPEIEEKNLVDIGEDEQYTIGLRYGKRLKKMFGDNISRVRFVSSSKDRAKESALALYEGLTEIMLQEAHDNLKPEIRDDLLRFHTVCGKFIDTVENNRTYLREYIKFKTSPLMQQVSEGVAKRLGMEHARLDAGELKLIYFLCTFEMIILEKDDWCQLLTDEEREILEYHNDMKQYWKKAYGHPIIGKMACPLVEQIFKNMDKSIDSILNNMKRRGDVATFYFGHAETLAPLYASLGLFNDSAPLLATNYDQMKQRKFKSSQILPFSANIALVLYDCNNGLGSQTSSPSEDNFVIRVFVNEQDIIIPACNDYVCRYQDVRDSYKHHVDHCNFESSCSLKNKHDEL